MKDVRAFIGLVGYYRIWIKGFAIIARPLYNLMKKDAVWLWGLDELAAMQKLQSMIVTTPVLAPLVFNDPRYRLIFLITNASIFG